MNEGLKFYRCNICGNLLMALIDSSVIPHCCGQETEKMSFNHGEEDGSGHSPVIERVDSRKAIVRVGLESHPMAAEHRIEWIALQDGARIDIQRLTLTGEPVADFTIRDGSGKLRAYALCNIHGLWESEG